jgi:nitrite reductase/ring-hydroxylating ferredoxin subunit
MSQWHEATRVAQIGNRSRKTVTLTGAAGGFFILDGAYFAREDLCNHIGSDLSSGRVAGERAVCP